MPTLFDAGDALRGERIVINARGLSRYRVIALTGHHETQEVIAGGDVYCVIEQPLRARPKGQP